MTPSLELDCRGELCPIPVLKLAKRITEVPIGAVVRVAADDPAAQYDIPAWCRLKGHRYLGTPQPATFDVKRGH